MVVVLSNFSWQQAALEGFKSAGYRGIIEAATGTGKTRVGIEAIKLLKTKILKKAEMCIKLVKYFYFC